MPTFDCDCCLISLREQFKSPAMCCVVEFEDVIARYYGAEYHMLSSNTSVDCDSKLVFIVILNFAQMRKIDRVLAKLRKQGKIVVLYLFDAWLNHGKLPIYRKLQNLVSPKYLFSRNYDLLCIPFQRTVHMLQSYTDAKVMHVPLAVDTSRCTGSRLDRPITFLAYGRQPKQLMNKMSTMANMPNSMHLLYHTDHMVISEIKDYYAHRRMFWSISERAIFSFAFDSYNPHQKQKSRFAFSFVGQRWFEAMSAGCVVVGRRPTCPEADQLFDWPDSTLDLDNDPEAASSQLVDWLGDRDRLRSIGLRNAAEVRRKHDWVNRLDRMEPEIHENLGQVWGLCSNWNDVHSPDRFPGGLIGRSVGAGALAEREGFEPSRRFPAYTFQACAFDHSATSPAAGRRPSGSSHPTSPGPLGRVPPVGATPPTATGRDCSASVRIIYGRATSTSTYCFHQRNQLVGMAPM